MMWRTHGDSRTTARSCVKRMRKNLSSSTNGELRVVDRGTWGSTLITTSRLRIQSNKGNIGPNGRQKRTRQLLGNEKGARDGKTSVCNYRDAPPWLVGYATKITLKRAKLRRTNLPLHITGIPPKLPPIPTLGKVLLTAHQ